MFKFLKDKLKGALSSFSKKVEETAEDVPAESPAEQPQADAPAPAPPGTVDVPQEKGLKDAKKEKKTKEKPAKKEPAKKDAEKPAIEAETSAPGTAAQELPEPPKITIPKEGFFSKIKKAFSKKEEPVPETAEKVDDHKPQYDEIIIEKPDVQIEGAPLKKVNIHEQRAEQELPIVEGIFEPIEPKAETPKKEQPPAGEFRPEKVAERIKGVKVKEEAEVKAAETTKNLPETTAKEAAKAEPEQPEKKGFFSRLREAVTTKKISGQQFDELFWDLEVALLENNVAIEVIEKIKQDLKLSLVDKPIPRGKVEDTILATLKTSLEELFVVPDIDLLQLSETKKPLVVCFVGINGSGKTTTIAKVAHMLKQRGKDVVLAAADTFRAAAIDQLQLHADKLGVKLIKHDYGADPAAVAFDAIKHAEATKKDLVLIDTAGRLHSNINLIDEMKKIVRVAKPDLILFIGESITGNDCVEQAKQFNEAVGINGIILSKADIDEKGGAAISVSYVTKKPILYLGVGQDYGDLKKFEPKALLESLGL